jgi:hypothetical protein
MQAPGVTSEPEVGLRRRWFAFWAVPSLFWLNASDASLLALAWLGGAAALALTLGFANAPLLLLLWLLYGLVRARGASVLRLRLGDAAARIGFSRDVPGAALGVDGALCCRGATVALT